MVEKKVLSLCLVDHCRRLKGHRGRHRRCPNLLQNLPKEIIKKIRKTSQTRGAQPYDRVPYQNRVNRCNRTVIPFGFRHKLPDGGVDGGYVIMVRPEEYFDPETREKKADFPEGVVIGENAFMIYDNRKDWDLYPPDNFGWEPCQYVIKGRVSKKRRPGGTNTGHYLARVPATTAETGGAKIVRGIPQGIRFFEYASANDCWKVEVQLAYLAWRTPGIEKVANGGMPVNLKIALEHENLNDDKRLRQLGVIDKSGVVCCPLCRNPIQVQELMEKIEQVEGREVVDLTVTAATLFHMETLRPGEFNHAAYKVGWGHYHCNTVARDMGVEKTWDWMAEVLKTVGKLRL